MNKVISDKSKIRQKTGQKARLRQYTQDRQDKDKSRADQTRRHDKTTYFVILPSTIDNYNSGEIGK